MGGDLGVSWGTDELVGGVVGRASVSSMFMSSAFGTGFIVLKSEIFESKGMYRCLKSSGG